MSSPMSLWQELALAALATSSLCYVLFFRVWSMEALGSDALFAIAVAAMAAAVATPDLFDEGARQVVEWSPLPVALGEADARAAALAALPGRLIDDLLARIGFEDSDEPADEEPPIPTDETSDATAAEVSTTDAAPGVFTAHVRPSIEGLVALLLRGATALAAGLTIVLAVALRTITSLARTLRRLAVRLDALEAEGVAAPALARDGADE